nr:ribosomal protein L2 [Coleochaete scutata]QFU80149.1 ribosomal protein L2 [Coleochaete scutata]
MRKSFKSLTFSWKKRSAGRNSSGRITVFHRGGGSKQNQRRIDFQRFMIHKGQVVRMEYDPCRTTWIALVRWSLPATYSDIDSFNTKQHRSVAEVGWKSEVRLPSSAVAEAGDNGEASEVAFERSSFRSVAEEARFPFEQSSRAVQSTSPFFEPKVSISEIRSSCFSYIPAWHGVKVGNIVNNYNALKKNIQKNNSLLHEVSPFWERAKRARNCETSPFASERHSARSTRVVPGSGTNDRYLASPLPGFHHFFPPFSELPFLPAAPLQIFNKPPSTQIHVEKSVPTAIRAVGESDEKSFHEESFVARMSRNVAGNSLFLCNIPIGTRVHNVELTPKKGAQICRAAGTFAELIEKMQDKCLVRFPSGKEQYLHPECRATIGILSNSEHQLKKLYKAGQNRWYGKRPTVRGVAMNPIDHPHGGGEGRTKGGRPSVSPWGKPSKGGFKTALRKQKMR